MPIIKVTSYEELERFLLPNYNHEKEQERVFKVEKRNHKVPSWFKEFLYLTTFTKPRRRIKWSKVVTKMFLETELQIKYVEIMSIYELWKYYLKLQEKARKMNMDIWELYERELQNSILPKMKRKKYDKTKMLKIRTNKEEIEEYEEKIVPSEKDLEMGRQILERLKQNGKYRRV